VVEGPVKKYFRRRRPFSDIVRVVVVGKRPNNWSFPSGHSAAAFAGVRMLERRLQRWRGLWYTLAGLVGFSRIYLGAHYPGRCRLRLAPWPCVGRGNPVAYEPIGAGR
jgi:membrane-associated phospholipid phosphatase